MAGVLEEHRRTFAILLSLVGICLILSGFGLIAYHQSQMEAGLAPPTSVTEETRVQVAKRLQQVLFFLLILVGVFSISLFAFVRWSRSYRRGLLRRPHPPTPAEDVWAMHKLPPDTDLEGPPEPGSSTT